MLDTVLKNYRVEKAHSARVNKRYAKENKGGLRMPGALTESELEELADGLYSVRSGILLTAWAIRALNDGDCAPGEAPRRYELYEGAGFVLELLARKMSETCEKLSGD